MTNPFSKVRAQIYLPCFVILFVVSGASSGRAAEEMNKPAAETIAEKKKPAAGNAAEKKRPPRETPAEKKQRAVEMPAEKKRPSVENSAQKKGPDVETPAEKKELIVETAAEGKKPAVGAAAEGEQSVDKLLATLNEALKENRKMRQEMQNLRDASGKLMAERNDIARQAQQIQQTGTQKERELNKKVADAKEQAETALKEAETLKKANGEAAAGRQELEKKIEDLNKANEEMKKNAENPGAGPARDEDIALAEKTEQEIKRAVGLVSGLNVENIELKERLVGSYFDLGNIYYDLGRYQEAIVQYEHALHLNPNLVWAHHNLAIIYDYRLNDIDRAIYYYRKYMSLKPPEEEAHEEKMRLWDMEQLSRLEPDEPLKKDFKASQKV